LASGQNAGDASPDAPTESAADISGDGATNGGDVRIPAPPQPTAGAVPQPSTQIGSVVDAATGISCEEEYRMLEAAVLTYVSVYGDDGSLDQQALIDEGLLVSRAPRYEVIDLGDIDPIDPACTYDPDGR
jgi:hypothetical protein